MGEEDSRKKLSRLTAVAIAAGVVVVSFAGARIAGLFDSGKPAVSGYNDKLSAVSTTDPDLILYTEIARIKTDLSNPAAITIGSDGRLYISGDNALGVYERLKGTQLGRFEITGSPTAICTDSDGNIYAAFQEHIEVYDSVGNLNKRWAKLDGKPFITSVSAGNSEIWAGDAGNRVIVKYDPAGQVIALVGKKDPAKNAPGIVVPSPHLDVAASDDGGVWVANPGRHEIELYAADGTRTRSWGKTSFAIDGFCGCCNPTDFALLPDGRFVTAEKGLPRVKTFLADGEFEGVVAGPESFKPEVVGMDLATDPQGRIFVLDPATGSVRVYASKGESN